MLGLHVEFIFLLTQDWAASLGFKMPGGVPMPPDLNIKQADFIR
jgi:hypothetical protein